MEGAPLIAAWLKRRADWLMLLALPLVLHAPELLGWLKSDPRLLNSGLAVGLGGGWVAGHGGFLDPNSAWTAQDLGHLAAEQWLSGRVPWWNSSIGVGMPLAAEMQPAALFLPFILLMHFQQGWLWLHILIQAIAGAGGYALLRGLGVSRTAGLLGAGLYAAHGTFAWFSHGPERAAAFLPWLLFAVERCRGTRGGGGGALLAVALAASIYAGWPETAFLDGMLVAAWTLLRLGQGPGRTGFSLRVALGLAAGLLLAMPAILPFVEYLSVADAGNHSMMAWEHLGAPGVAMLLLPYINGPIAAMGQPMWVLWGNVGGYVGLSAAVLAIAGALGSRTETALRRLLAAWLVLCVARVAGFGPAEWLINLIPLAGQTAFFRYVVPALAMPACVLAAFAIDDWRIGHRSGGQSSVHVLLGSGCALALIAICVWLCLPIAVQLWWSALYRWMFTASIAAAVGATLILSALLSRPASRNRVLALAALVCADTVGCYLVARAGAPQTGALDAGPARFLQARAGLDRFVSLGGGIGINESAWQGLAGIAATSLPVPRLWSDFVRGQLHGDPILFRYTDTPAARLIRDAPVLRSLGVGWLTVGRGLGPAHLLGSVDAATPRRPEALLDGVPVGGIVAQGLPGAAALTHVGVDIGTYQGRADGELVVTLAAGGVAATGSAAIVGAADNGALDITLDHALPPQRSLRWSIVQRRSRHAVALWRYGSADAPRFTTAAVWPDLQPELDYTSQAVEIYRLVGAAAYWQADGCSVTEDDRAESVTRCNEASGLLRRELFFPGWRATVNGRPAVIRRDGLFQRVAVPQGRAEVRFAYAPPGIGWAYAAGLAGLAITMVMGWPSRAAGRPRDC
jgi:hypothetical protein